MRVLAKFQTLPLVADAREGSEAHEKGGFSGGHLLVNVCLDVGQEA